MIHQGSLETYQYISDWIHPDFPFSRRDGWDRFGILGVLGDFIIPCTYGDILEIGIGESTVYFVKLAQKYNRKVYHCDVQQSVFENAKTVEGYFGNNSILFIGSSDRLFNEITLTPIALGFIDGDHTYEQAKKDFYNLLPYVVDDGYILLHDTYPTDESYLSENRCGEVYKLRQEIEKDKRFDCLTIPRGVAMDVGFSIVRKKPPQLSYYNE